MNEQEKNSLPRYLCSGNNKNTWLVFFIFAAIAVVAFLAMQLQIADRLIAQVILFIALIVAAYVQIRYVATAYLYEVIQEDRYYLLVIRVQGRKKLTQCKFALDDLKEICHVDTRKGERPLPPDGVPTQNYSAYLFSDTYSLLLFAEGEEKNLLRINADEKFFEALALLLPPKEAPCETQEV